MYWRCCCLLARFSSSSALAGPTTSSARVSAETAMIDGSRSLSIVARSTATDVSIRPRSSVNPVAGRRVLIDVTVDVRPELLVGDAGRTLERIDEDASRNKLTPLVRAQLTDRLPVARHDEVLAGVESSNHLAAVVAQLSLSQLLLRHRTHCSTRASLKFRSPKEIAARKPASRLGRQPASRLTARAWREPRPAAA